MASPLANGGCQPQSGDPVIEAVICQHVLAVVVTTGLCEPSGDCLDATGLPGQFTARFRSERLGHHRFASRPQRRG